MKIKNPFKKDLNDSDCAYVHNGVIVNHPTFIYLSGRGA